MLPSILAKQLEKGLLDYITTTFPMTNEPFKGSLEKMLSKKDSVFHEPYIAVRMPFRTAQEMPSCFEAIKPSYKPYVHQEKAFARLIGEEAKSTLIATGTGSGKTECFLYPILEYCYKHAGEPGIKAIIIYPMNALASDQAKRLANEIYSSDKLRGNVTAGMYVGGIENKPTTCMEKDKVITDHATMLNRPPDILLTNYKMLDYLLVRPKDAVLWNDNHPDTLKFIAVDELHTFDGAQGTDLACLIRRLKKRLEVDNNKLCCIGTSATMGSEDSAKEILDYAAAIFDVPFDDAAVITEDRLTAQEYFSGSSITEFQLPNAGLDQIMESLISQDDESRYLSFVAGAWFPNFGKGIMSPEGRVYLGERLKQHAFVQALLMAMKGRYCQVSELIEALNVQYPELYDVKYAETIIYSIMALISHARVASGTRLNPFLHVQVQLWIRELRRFLAKVDNDIDYSIFHDLNEQQAKQYLPVVNCRDCGSTGWVTILNERGYASISNLDTFYNKFFQIDPHVLMLFPFANEQKMGDMYKAKICPFCMKVYTNPSDKNTCTECGTELIEVQCHANHEEEHKRGQYICPVCGSRRGISIIGLRNATEISALMSQIFASKFNDDKKTLAFSDSVQDAAHKAGFFNSRTWHSGLRSAIQEVVKNSGRTISLQAFCNSFIEYWHRKYEGRLEDYIGMFIAPNMVWRKGYESICENKRYTGTNEEKLLLYGIDQRLRYEIMLEYGVTSKIGRTLEKSGCSILAFDLQQIARIANNVQERAINELGILTNTSSKALQQMVLGYMNLVKQSGAFDDKIFYPMINERGNTYLISAKHNYWLPGRKSGRNTARFPLAERFGARTKDGIGYVAEKKYKDWVYEFLDIGGLNRESDVDDICRFIAEEAVKEKVFNEIPSSLPTKVYGLNKHNVYISRNVKQLVCDKCGSIYPFEDKASGIMENVICFRHECQGRLYLQDKAALDYYGNLYNQGDAYRINAREHTGLLKRKDRENLENNFKLDKTKCHAWDPNVLSCTPTLEMGIDIGDLSTVILCSMPPAQAQFLQRVGRAGRKDGNALTLAVANARQRDLYYYAEPREMIDGNVRAPKVFLKANAVLERQFVAYAMDSWVKKGIPDNAIPPNISLVLRNLEKHPDDIFPFNFLKYVQENLTSLTEEFIAMFQGQLDEYVQNEIIKFAKGEGLTNNSMRVKILEVFNQQKQEIDAIMADVKTINERIKELEKKPKDSTIDADIKVLTREKAAYYKVVQELNNKNIYNFLSDEGLLPNYTFPEAGVTLKAILYRKEEQEEGAQTKEEKEPLIFEYNRSASAAISEFAPNNSFYADGKKMTIDRLDVNNSKPVEWRMCPNCSYMEIYDSTKHHSACPRCGCTTWNDSGQLHDMLKVQMVYSTGNIQDMLIGDETDDRSNVFYKKLLLVDVDEEHDIISAYRMDNDEFAFGYEFVRKADIKEINFGELERQGQTFMVAGNEIIRKGFKICRHCGKIQNKTRDNHTAFCNIKNKAIQTADDYIDCLFLYREFNTEALRILIPATTQATTTEKKESFVAAFMLGMQEYFGNVSHLRATVSEVPVPDAAYRKQYLVIYDSVPGGTGYLKQLMSEQNAFVDILQKALTVLEKCSCNEDPQKDGCYRCLYAFRQGQNIGNVSRDAAVKMLKTILKGKDNIQKIPKLSDIPVNTLFDSELEALFIEAFSRMNNAQRSVSIEKDIINGKEGYLLKVNDQLWEIEPQVTLSKGQGVCVMCKPDFIIRPLKSNNKLPIAVFTDGFTFHKDIVDSDTLKREAIRRSGKYRVWSLSYNDVKQVFDDQGDYCTNTLDFTKMPRGRVMYDNMLAFLKADKLSPEKKSSFELLMDYLSLEDAESLFKKYAQAYSYNLIHLVFQKQPEQCKNCYATLFNLCQDANFDDMGITCDKLVLGEWKPRLEGDLVIYAYIPMSDFAKKVNKVRVFVFIKDKEGERSAHYKEEWNGLWRFHNLMQFLPEFMAVSQKGLESAFYKGLDFVIAEDIPALQVAAPNPWNEIIDEQLFDEDSIAFAKQLKELGIMPDKVGYEVISGNEEIIIELAWSDKRIAYLTADEAEHKMALQRLGWTVVQNVAEIKSLITGGK